MHHIQIARAEGIRKILREAIEAARKRIETVQASKLQPGSQPRRAAGKAV